MTLRLPPPITEIDDDTPTLVFDDVTRPIAINIASMPRLIEGTELVGEFEGSGYRDPPQLVSRPDRQLVRLPSLLYLVVKLLAGQPLSDQVTPPPGGYRSLSQVADGLSRETGRRYSAEHINFLVDKKLAPLGITTYSNGSVPPTSAAARPFLAFRFRMTVVSENRSWFLSGLFAWLYQPLIVIFALAAFTFSEVWVGSTQDIGAAMRESLLSPVNILIVALLAVASAAFHELGHATACRYGGVRPGSMGCGIYLVWPAFYTDITNTYRLGRAGRIRADLGGVYFNALFVVGLAALYVWTGYQPLLVAILSVNLEIIQQLLPTLRFDGYYIIADLVGIPDLFKYIGPILKRVFLGRPDERLAALKRWPQRVVAVWVVCVIPALVLQLGLVAVNIPGLLQSSWQKIQSLAENVGGSGNYPLEVVAAAVQILFLLLPVAGLALLFTQLVRAVVGLLRRGSALLGIKHADRKRVGRHEAPVERRGGGGSAKLLQAALPPNRTGRRLSAPALDGIGTVVRLGLAAVWIVSGLIKVMDPEQTYLAVKAYEVLPAAMVGPVADVLPLLELVLGLLVLVGVGTRLVVVLSAVLLLVFIAAVAQAWARGLAIDCGCFGGGGQVSPDATRYGRELLRDAAFFMLAGWLLVRPQSWASVDGMTASRATAGNTAAAPETTAQRKVVTPEVEQSVPDHAASAARAELARVTTALALTRRQLESARAERAEVNRQTAATRAEAVTVELKTALAAAALARQDAEHARRETEELRAELSQPRGESLQPRTSKKVAGTAEQRLIDGRGTVPGADDASGQCAALPGTHSEARTAGRHALQVAGSG